MITGKIHRTYLNKMPKYFFQRKYKSFQIGLDITFFLRKKEKNVR
jgi:hypothetical protein